MRTDMANENMDYYTQTERVIEAFKQKYPEKEVTEDNLIEFTRELYLNKGPTQL